MKFFVDFHIHSKYSRATSPQMELEFLAKAAETKGILVLGTGDFTHPQWFASIKEKLEPAEPGLFKLKDKSGQSPTRFILTAEISCIYSKNNRVRKVHTLIFAPDFKAVEEINARLGWIGNLKSDGRPILGLDVKELTKIALTASDQCLVVPGHIWTPWFSLLGSKSGFDSLEECFEDLSPHIYAAETGLSSDPAMNWRLSFLDSITLISNGDAHSPAKLGREANVFDTDLSYSAISDALKQKDGKNFLGTIEFFPEEGKYHFDGHRACNTVLSPQETKKNKGLCPVCGKPVTIGVLNRVEELADREQGFKPANGLPYKSLIPLQEIIAEVLGVGVASKQVQESYQDIVSKLDNEFNVLLYVSESDLKQAASPEIAEAITRMRQGKVNVEPGYDGVYGKVSIFSEAECKAGVGKTAASGQSSLF